MMRLTFLSGIASSVAAAVTDDLAQLTEPYQQSASGHSIAVLRVVPAGRAADGVKLRAVTIRYEFTGQRNLHLNTLGTVPSKGGFTFTTRASELVFSDSTGVRVTVPVRETAVFAGPSDEQIPSLDQFTTSYEIFRYRKGDAFIETLYPVIQKYSLACSGDAVVSNFRYYVTTYCVIPTSDPHVFCKIALSIRIPEPAPQGEFRYGINQVAREKNVGGDWHDIAAPASSVALRDFVRKIADALGA